jgi:hypothetical protein
LFINGKKDVLSEEDGKEKEEKEEEKEEIEEE